MNTLAHTPKRCANFSLKGKRWTSLLVVALAGLLIQSASLAADPSPTLAQATRRFTTAFKADPLSVGALLKGAYAAFPANLPTFVEAAIKAAKASGQPDLIPLIVADAIKLDPGQRAALTVLALSSVPESLGERILADIAALLSGHGTIPSLGALGGTINPANIGGTVISNERP